MASDLQDTALQTMVDGGDLTALEAKYHLSCLTDKVRTLIVMEMRVKFEQGLLLSLLLL